MEEDVATQLPKLVVGKETADAGGSRRKEASTH